MSRSTDELWAMLNEAQRMPYGAAQIALIEQVLRHADGGDDPDLAFSARMLGTNAYVYGGEPAKSFVTFSWCLSDFDRNPQPHHARWKNALLWHFKYMVSALTKFPEVPLARTYAVLDDMERRYREDGHSMQAVHKHRFLVARHVGDRDLADELYEKWTTAPRDALSDCAGCDPSTRVDYLSERGRDDEAVALAEPVLAGRLSCNEQPQTILSALMVPYLRTGRLDEAADAHRRSYRVMRGNLADLWDIGDHIDFCARTGNEHRGLEMLQRHIDWLDRAPSPAAGMTFAASGAMLLRRIAGLGHGDATVHRADRGDVPAEALAEELAAYATTTAERFDARNGTTAQSTWIAERLAAEPYGVDLPLSPSARRSSARPAPPPAPVAVPAEPEPVIPDDADPAVLLDLAEEHERQDRDAGLAATLAAFDERFADPETLGPEPAARRAMLLGGQRWTAGDPEGGRDAWSRAADLFAAAGNEVAASAARGRLGVARAALNEPGGLALIEADVAYQQQHGDARQRAVAHSRYAMVLSVEERFAEAAAAQDRADAAAAEVGDPRLAARFALRRAQIRAARGDHAGAAAAAGEAVEFYREHGPAGQLAAADAVLGQTSPDAEVSVAAYTEALALGEPRLALEVRLGRAHALLRLGRPAEAVPDLVEAVALCTEQDLADGAAFTRQTLAEAYLRSGRPVEAAEVAEEAVTWLDRLGHSSAADDARLLLANAYVEVNDSEGALARYDELIERLGENPAGRGQLREYAGDLLFKLDRDAAAAERFGQAADDLRAAGDPLGELRMLRRRVTALHWADDLPAALETVRLGGQRHSELAGDVEGQPVGVWERAAFGREAAQLLMARGRYAEALPHLAGSPQRLRAIGADADADHVEGMYGEALLRSGQPAEAERVLRALVARLTSEDDGEARQTAAVVLAETLDALGRTDEADALRKQAEIDT